MYGKGSGRVMWMYYSHGTNHSKGVMVMIKEKVDYEVKECIIDINGHLLFQMCSLIIRHLF